ncbi:max-binding protein MNT isoform X2 [Cheilinus undulatus]|uniref:max-binding protein MNT isoform X2 n=1 Tax=Cheilinus undulatus TaxID=241271 RepID=UPI001BD24C08|nr:max-binding protein MNT isoform X2 [Cheilinus undulatus]
MSRNRHPILMDTIQPAVVQAIINPKRGMEGTFQTPQTPRTCSSPGSAGKSCWSPDVRVVVLLVTVAGVVILLLLYRLLQLRHRLRMARARHALEYHSFFHSATYTLKHPDPRLDLPTKNGSIPDTTPPVLTVPPTATVAPLPPPPTSSLPPLPLPPPPVLPPPPLHAPPSLPPPAPVLTFPLPLPVIHTTPPSPHLSWGACSDVDLYSRIGAYRPSRLSSISNQSKVILFEHSSL